MEIKTEQKSGSSSLCQAWHPLSPYFIHANDFLQLISVIDSLSIGTALTGGSNFVIYNWKQEPIYFVHFLFSVLLTHAIFQRQQHRQQCPDFFLLTISSLAFSSMKLGRKQKKKFLPYFAWTVEDLVINFMIDRKVFNSFTSFYLACLTMTVSVMVCRWIWLMVHTCKESHYWTSRTRMAVRIYGANICHRSASNAAVDHSERANGSKAQTKSIRQTALIQSIYRLLFKVSWVLTKAAECGCVRWQLTSVLCVFERRILLWGRANLGHNQIIKL